MYVLHVTVTVDCIHRNVNIVYVQPFVYDTVLFTEYHYIHYTLIQLAKGLVSPTFSL